MKIFGVPIPTEVILDSKNEIKGRAVIFSDISVIPNNTQVLVIRGLITPAIVYRNITAMAIISEQGSWNSHGVSLALANNIPCIVGVGQQIEYIQDNLELTLNFHEGTINY